MRRTPTRTSTFMTDDACEAGYRGAVVREGKEGTRAGPARPCSRNSRRTGPTSSAAGASARPSCCTRRSPRAPDGDKFEVMSIYSFEGDKVSRVEFIR